MKGLNFTPEEQTNIVKYWLSVGRLKRKTERKFDISRDDLNAVLRASGYA